HLAQHPLRHEVGVHIDQAAQAEPLPEAPHSTDVRPGGAGHLRLAGSGPVVARGRRRREVIAHAAHDHLRAGPASTPRPRQNRPSCTTASSAAPYSLTGTDSSRPAAGSRGHPVSNRVSSTTTPAPVARCRSGPAAATSSPITAPPATSSLTSPTAGGAPPSQKARTWSTGRNGSRSSDSGHPPRATAR